MSRLHKAEYTCLTGKEQAKQPNTARNYALSEDTLGGLVELGRIYQQIHKRLISEGIKVENGGNK